MKSCFFIGHRETNITILPELIQEVERHITEYGVYDFAVGRYGNFDRLAAIAVRDAKKRHQQVTLTLLHPELLTCRYPNRRNLMQYFIRPEWRASQSGLPLFVRINI